MDFEEDETDEYEGVYEDGHWEWDERLNELIFIDDRTTVSDDLSITTTGVIGPVEFRDDMDLIEQQKFRKRMQRKPEGDEDIVTLQDVKDVVLFTAPMSLLSSHLINLLHVPATERLLRALILYCQYFIEVADEMNRRNLDAETKIRTDKTFLLELEYRTNLEDLRLLIAKEYSSLIIGGGDFYGFHHMGLLKKRRSMSRKESLLFEGLLRISVQIIWVALGRKALNQIEIEVHRIFKSRRFNLIEHKLKINCEANMTEEEQFVLIGHCLCERTLQTHSPVLNELSYKQVDYRLLGLGSVKYERLNSRLQFFEHILTADEKEFQNLKLSLGIIGLKRNRFDILLKEIRLSAPSGVSASATFIRPSQGRLITKSSRGSQASRKSATSSVIKFKLYPDIVIPIAENEDHIHLAEQFPRKDAKRRPCNDAQRLKWLARLARARSKQARRNRRCKGRNMGTK